MTSAQGYLPPIGKIKPDYLKVVSSQNVSTTAHSHHIQSGPPFGRAFGSSNDVAST
jgi:hypothetical protein